MNAHVVGVARHALRIERDDTCRTGRLELGLHDVCNAFSRPVCCRAILQQWIFDDTHALRRHTETRACARQLHRAQGTQAIIVSGRETQYVQLESAGECEERRRKKHGLIVGMRRHKNCTTVEVACVAALAREGRRRALAPRKKCPWYYCNTSG